MDKIKSCFVLLVIFKGNLIVGDNEFGGDTEFVISLAKYFNARQIVLVQGEKELTQAKIFQTWKSLLNSGNNFYVSATQSKDISEILKKKKFTNTKILAILRSEDVSRYLKFLQLSQNEKFSSLIWAVITPHLNITLYENISVPFDRQFIIAKGNKFSGYKMTEIYDTGSKKFRNYFGGWKKETGLIAPPLNIFSRRKNFMGSEITISSVGNDSCVEPYYLLDVREIVKCVHIQAWRIISEVLNLTIVHGNDEDPNISFLKRVEKFGVESSYENWALKVQITEDFSFLWPTWKTNLEIYTAYQGQALEWRTFIRPYDTKVWAAVGASILVSTVVMILVRACRVFPEDGEMANSDYFLLPYFAFCNQGVSNTPKGFNYRALFLLSFLTPAVMLPAYSAVLTSFLTTPYQQTPFTDIDGLSSSKLYKFGSVKDFHIAHFLKNDPSPAAQNLLHTKLASPLPLTIRDGILKMCKEKFSFLCIAVSMNFEKVPCKFFKLDRPFLIDYFGMPFRKNSPYKIFVNRALRNLAFTGVFEALKDRVTNYAYKVKIERKDEDEVPITFENTVALFIVVSAGVVTANFVLLMEMVYRRYFKERDGLRCKNLIKIKSIK